MIRCTYTCDASVHYTCDSVHVCHFVKVQVFMVVGSEI